jgi:hypothetical protein
MGLDGGGPGWDGGGMGRDGYGGWPADGGGGGEGQAGWVAPKLKPHDSQNWPDLAVPHRGQGSLA